MKRHVVALMLVVSGCTRNPTESTSNVVPVRDLTGAHPLVAYNAQPLPVAVVPINTRDGNPTGCFVQISSGQLQVWTSGGAGSFALQYAQANSCTGASMGGYSWGGQVTLTGTDLTLRSIGADGLVTMVTGQITRDSTIVLDQQPVLTFSLHVSP